MPLHLTHFKGIIQVREGRLKRLKGRNTWKKEEKKGRAGRSVKE